MDELEEYAEQLQDADSGAPERGGGCGCLGWAVAAIVFLVLGGSALGAWWPFIAGPVAFIVVGAGFWILFDSLRNWRVHGGSSGPTNAGWHPASSTTGGRRTLRAGARSSGPVAATQETTPGSAAPPDQAPPPGAPPPTPAVTPVDLAGGMVIPSLMPEPLTDAPQAPQAPEAPTAPATPH